MEKSKICACQQAEVYRMESEYSKSVNSMIINRVIDEKTAQCLHASIDNWGKERIRVIRKATQHNEY